MFTWLRKSDKGFTLVELMMVIVILGILAGVAIPLIGNMQEKAWVAKLNSSADAIGPAVIYDDTSNELTTLKDAADLDDIVNLPTDVQVKTDADECTAAIAGCLFYDNTVNKVVTITPYYKSAAQTVRTYKW